MKEDSTKNSIKEISQKTQMSVSVIFILLSLFVWGHEVQELEADAKIVVLAIFISLLALCIAQFSLRNDISAQYNGVIFVAITFLAVFFCYAVMGYSDSFLFFLIPILLSSILIASIAPIFMMLIIFAFIFISPNTVFPPYNESVLIIVMSLLISLISNVVKRELIAAWHYADKGITLSREVRVRQGEVNRLNRALTVSNNLLKRSLNELALAQREMAEAKHLKEQFATTVSHELRTPLSIILGFIDVILRYPETYGDVNWTQPLRRDLGEIQRSARYLSNLVDDILDLARIQALKMTVHKEETDIVVLIREVVVLAQRLLLDNPEVKINVSLPKESELVYIDPIRVRQVLLNLLANACRFTAKGYITVCLTNSSDEMIVSVQDSGPGIPDDQLETIFDEFHQTGQQPVNDSYFAGKGLGLAIAKHFVTKHGGRIWATSNFDSSSGMTGSTFYFSLPYGNKQIIDLSQPPIQPYAGDYRQSIILVDNEDGKKLLDRRLDGYEVFLAKSVNEARQLLLDTHSCAVIINVPPLADTTAQNHPIFRVTESIPIIQCTLPVGHWNLEASLFDDWILKPCDSEKLLSAIGKGESPKKALVVDDDKSFARFIRRVLNVGLPKCEVTLAATPDEVLQLARNDNFDVIVMDIAMPEQDGRSLSALIRQECKGQQPRIIAVTGVQPGLEGQTTIQQTFSISSISGFNEETVFSLLNASLKCLCPQCHHIPEIDTSIMHPG